METLIKLDELTNTYPDHLWLEFSETESKEAWQMAQAQSYPVGRQNAYLNILALKVLTKWLEAEPDIEDSPQVWPNEGALPSIWEFVNGTAITLSKTRVVILPSESNDLEELRVPQEWVDIAGWQADYYLAVEIELTERWLRVWGYTTHKQLKATASLDTLDKTYAQKGEDLIEDLNAMLLAREFCANEREEVVALPELSANQAEELLAQWGKQLSYSPRILIPFEQWGALIAASQWRQALYQRRLESTRKEVQTLTAPTKTAASPSKWIDTAEWVRGMFEQGWQSIESLLSDAQLSLAERVNTQPRLAYNLRSGESVVRRAKLIDLGIQLGERAVALLIARATEPDGKIRVQVQLHPAGGATFLPPHLKLTLVDEAGKLVQAPVESRTQDNMIQLKGFKASAGIRFSVQVSLGDVSVSENFAL